MHRKQLIKEQKKNDKDVCFFIAQHGNLNRGAPSTFLLSGTANCPDVGRELNHCAIADLLIWDGLLSLIRTRRFCFRPSWSTLWKANAPDGQHLEAVAASSRATIPPLWGSLMPELLQHGQYLLTPSQPVSHQSSICMGIINSFFPRFHELFQLPRSRTPKQWQFDSQHR